MAYLIVGVVKGKAVERRPRIFRDRSMLLDTLDDESLIRRYRMPRHALFDLINVLRIKIEPETQRSKPLSPETKVLITVRYLSKGVFFSELADLHGVSSASVSRAIDLTIKAICSSMKLISFPKSKNEQQRVAENFYELAGFPRVIGAVDGTLIPIIRPPGDEEAAYVCRKGYHALNVQAVCDADLRFTNVVTKWPGSTHDSFILQNSGLGNYLEGQQLEGWLLGDSGYACRPYLLTPMTNPASPAEERYNTSHIKTRNTIERAFGLLKSRYRCLHKTTGCLPFSVEKCHRLIFAACQLHNYAINMKLPVPDVQDDDDVDDERHMYNGPVQDGYATRRAVINRTFTY